MEKKEKLEEIKEETKKKNPAPKESRGEKIPLL